MIGRPLYRGLFYVILNNEENIKKMTLDYYKVQLKRQQNDYQRKEKVFLLLMNLQKLLGKDYLILMQRIQKRIVRPIVVCYSPHQTWGKSISGAILFEETLYQNHADGESMVDKLTKQGIIPGIKVDKGLKPLPGALEHETYCSGLDGI